MNLAEDFKTRNSMDIPTLVDCGCVVTVWKDGSGAEIDYCPLHRWAEDMFQALKGITGIDNPPVGAPDHIDFHVAVEAGRLIVEQIKGGGGNEEQSDPLASRYPYNLGG